MKIITVIENNVFDVNGEIITNNDPQFRFYKQMFNQKCIDIKIGAQIVKKQVGRPKGTNKVYRTVYVEKTALNTVLNVVKVLNKDQRILDNINEGQESDVEPYTWDTLPPVLNEFWSEYFKK